MTTKELTENPKEACSVWPETTWNGFNVHKVLYELIENEIEPFLTNKGYKFQECYLAYLDHTNCGDEPNGFIVGWDIWTDTGFTSAYCQFEVEIEYDGIDMAKPFLTLSKRCKREIQMNNSLEFEGINKCGGFYHYETGAYKKLRNEWGGLIELRLD